MILNRRSQRSNKKVTPRKDIVKQERAEKEVAGIGRRAGLASVEKPLRVRDGFRAK